MRLFKCKILIYFDYFLHYHQEDVCYSYSNYRNNTSKQKNLWVNKPEQWNEFLCFCQLGVPVNGSESIGRQSAAEF